MERPVREGVVLIKARGWQRLTYRTSASAADRDGECCSHGAHLPGRRLAGRRLQAELVGEVKRLAGPVRVEQQHPAALPELEAGVDLAAAPVPVLPLLEDLGQGEGGHPVVLH